MTINQIKNEQRDRIYMICQAYESGFGKGSDLDRESVNPWSVGSDQYVAWQIGFVEGRDRAASRAKEASVDQDDVENVCDTCGRNTNSPLFDGCMNDPCPLGHEPRA